MNVNRDVNILYVDDEKHNLASFKASFRNDYNVHLAISAKEGLDMLSQIDNINIIIADQRMPDLTGVQFLKIVTEKYPHAIRILLTGYSDIQVVIAAINEGKVYRYITKPWDEYEIKEVISSAYEVFRFKHENAKLLFKYSKLFFDSSDPMFIINNKGGIIEVNKAMKDMFDISNTEMKTIGFLKFFKKKSVKENLINQLKANKVVKDFKTKIKDKNNHEIDCLISVKEIRNDKGELIGCHGSIKDISTHIQAVNTLV